MGGTGWLTCSRADVPRDRRWLGERERATLAQMKFERRRADWLLGRWAAKRAVGAWLGVPAERVEVVAAPDGAPEAQVAGRDGGVSLSISHRGGRALAAVGDGRERVGCDIEVVEPRSAAFMREWLTPGERALVAAARDPALAANLVWTAKEAGAKARREGLRLDLGAARVELGEGTGGWRPLTLRWPDAPSTAGWWRSEPGWVMTVAGAPSLEPPHPL